MPPLQHQHTRHTSSLQLHPHTHHIVTPGFVDRPRRSDCTAGQMDGEAGWWTTCGNIGLPPLARVMGVGRQQQEESDDLKVVLTKWQSDYYTLYNSCSITDNNFMLYVSDVLYNYDICTIDYENVFLNEPITMEEVQYAIQKLKSGKAAGFVMKF